jgi:hypothetical protein
MSRSIQREGVVVVVMVVIVVIVSVSNQRENETDHPIYPIFIKLNDCEHVEGTNK